MGRHQTRLLLCSAASLALIVGALFVVDWFRIDLGSTRVSITMTSMEACTPGDCKSISFYALSGLFPRLARLAFATGLLTMLLVLVQCGTKLFGDHANARLSRIGYGLGSLTFAAGFIAAYMTAPAPTVGGELSRIMGVAFERTWAPPMLLAGSLLAMVALYYAQHDGHDDMGGEYKPVVIARGGEPRLPVTPLSVNRVPHPGSGVVTPPARERLPDSLPLEGGRPDAEAPRTKSPSQPGDRTRSPSQPGDRTKSPSQPGDRTKSPSQPGPNVAHTTSPAHVLDRTKSSSQQPLAARTKSPTEPHEIDIERSRTSSSGPIDLAARLSGAPIAVAIKPPKPEPIPVPPDQIPVAPESGLVIRKRTASAGSITVPPEVGLTIRTKPPSQAPPVGSLHPPPLELPTPPTAMPAIESDNTGDLALALGAGPSALRGKIRFALATVTLTSAGIAAQREDGVKKLVAWDAIVGIIARRLPTEVPYDGSAFADLVSTAGSTLRFLPWTKISGALLLGEGEERVRSFVQLVAMRCLDAKLDSRTRAFAEGSDSAAQLPSAQMLAAHDERLA